MATLYEKDAVESAHTPDSGSANADGTFADNYHAAAVNGNIATDNYGNALVTIDPAAERRLRRKIDFYVVPTVAMLYLFCFIDRANIGNARIAGLERDLGMSGYDYNILLSVFYVSYILFELPSNILCKWMGPGWFIPLISLGFGIASLGTAWVNNLSAACGVRFVLGIFEAGMLPGIAYYLSRWYRRSELTYRLALYLSTAPLAGAFGGLLASGILSLDSWGSLRSWRMIFAIEGIITIGLALISFLTLTDRPETAKWLSKEEKELAIARLKIERVGTTEILEKLNTTTLIRGIFSPVTLSVSGIFLMINITVQGLAFFAPTIVRTIYPTETVVGQQLRTVPPYIVGAAICIGFNWASYRLDKRLLIFIAASPLMMTGYLMFLATELSQGSVRYAATFLIAGGAFTFGPLCSAEAAANVVTDTARSGAIGMVVMIGNIGGLISTWSFLPGDAPNYPIGNGLNFATSSVVFLGSIVLLWWMKRDNKRREQGNVDERLAGLDKRTVQNLDWKHPGFRWKP